MSTTPRKMMTTTSKLAAEYRPSMTTEVLHSWAADAAKELNALYNSEHEKATRCMQAVIQFALDDDCGLEFLRCWNEGDFEAIRNEWPDAPEDVFFADPLYRSD